MKITLSITCRISFAAPFAVDCFAVCVVRNRCIRSASYLFIIITATNIHELKWKSL